MPARSQKSTYLEQANELPPRLCFAIARQNRRAITQLEIAEATQWSLKKVARLCNLDSWATVTVADMDKFRAACQIDRRSERRHRFFVRRSLTSAINGFNHLRKPGRRLPKFIREIANKTS